jgi:hypothetical protein
MNDFMFLNVFCQLKKSEIFIQTNKKWNKDKKSFSNYSINLFLI